MYNFSSNVLVFPDRIVFKDNKKTFKISERFYFALKRLHHFIFLLKDDYSMFVLREGIKKGFIIESKNEYDPFVKEHKGELCRAFIQLTNRCNLKCLHCYANSCIENNQFIDYEHLIKFLRLCIDNGIYEIDFTGGEPFLYPRIWELLEWLSNKPVKTSIFTNLTTVNEDDLKRIEGNRSIVKIITSIDYFSPQKHNLFRNGHDAYQKTMRNIMFLKSIKQNVVVNSIVMNDNHEELLKLVSFLKKEGINVVLDTIIFEGRMKGKDNSYTARKNNCKFCSTIYNNINDLDKIDIKHLECFNLPFYQKHCGVGKRLFFVLSSGFISFCPSLTDKPYLSDIKFYDVDDFDYIHKFISSSHKLECKHKECLTYEQCLGGCRAKALFDYGDICERDIDSCFKYGIVK